MDDEVTVEPTLDDLNKTELEARKAANAVRIQKLRGRAAELTGKELAELRRLQAELPEIDAKVAEFEAVLNPAPVAETPAPVAETPAPAPVVEAPAPAPAVAPEADVVAEAEQVLAEATANLVTASAGSGSGFHGLTEGAAAPKASAFRVASAGGTRQVGDELSLKEIGEIFINEFEARKTTSAVQNRVRVASAYVLDESWDQRGLATDNSIQGNAAVIAEAKRRHRLRLDAARQVGRRTAAPLGTLPMPVGTPLVFRDVPNAYATTNGSEIIDRIAPVPLATAVGACQVTYQLPHTKANLVGAAVVWDTTNQAAVDPDVPSTWKPMVVPPAVATDTVSVVAFPVGYVIENCYKYQNPQAVANDLHIVSSLANDVKVSYALGRMDAKSRKLTHDATSGYGAFVELRGALRMINGYIKSLGLDPEFTDYALVVDAGLIDLLGYDEDAAGSYGQGIMARGEVLGELSTFGYDVIEVSQTEVGRTSPWAGFASGLPAVGASAVAMPNGPATFKVRLVDFAGWWSMTPPEVAFGIVEDFSLMRQNRTAMWGESWLGMGYDSPAEQFSISITLDFSGARQARKDVSGAAPLFA